MHRSDQNSLPGKRHRLTLNASAFSELTTERLTHLPQALTFSPTRPPLALPHAIKTQEDERSLSGGLSSFRWSVNL